MPQEWSTILLPIYSNRRNVWYVKNGKKSRRPDHFLICPSDKSHLTLRLLFLRGFTVNFTKVCDSVSHFRLKELCRAIYFNVISIWLTFLWETRIWKEIILSICTFERKSLCKFFARQITVAIESTMQMQIMSINN